MEINSESFTNSYFGKRNVSPADYKDYSLPRFFHQVLPDDKNISILDIGCGLGQNMTALKKLNYNNLTGIDIDEEAVGHCHKMGLNVFRIRDLLEFCSSYQYDKFDFIIMSHVLEHLAKDEIIPSLSAIKTMVLKDGGKMFVLVPNAQSNTGCYWAYEDFTHTTLFTAGSLFFVLRSVGFKKITLINAQGLDGVPFIKRVVKSILLKLYIFNKRFWNRVTSSDYHGHSPLVFSFDIKVLAE